MKKWLISADERTKLIAALPSDMVRIKQTLLNFDHNRKVFASTGQKLLNGQRTSPLCDMRYGTYPLSWNGCELIACYNAAKMLGREIDFPQVVFEFELNRMHYLFPNGYWGTAPKKLWYFFKKHDMPYTSCRDGALFARSAKTSAASCGIISFWNNKRSTAKFGKINFFSGGLHTVAYRWRAGRFYVYNLYGGDSTPRILGDIAEAYKEKRFIIGYIFEGDIKNF